ncbi:glycosyltransferase family 4 protein [Marinobacter sp. ELB17]|uniref:glycosyltransferase family 4 protein n=1 Tax=Marinobacter sp. ELB17 TaxID=270374 RepID=UPI000306A4C0|nr:glycosyltransferase family 4 protein [Marinobacter sp. ELB17]
MMGDRNMATESPSQKPLRVLHVTFNMGIGGTEQVIRQLVQGMIPEGVESEILCIDGQIGPIGETLQQSGVPVHKLTRKQGFDWSLVAGIRKRLREGRFDVVHCHQYTPWLYGWLAALGTGARVVFTEHGRFYPDRHRYKAMLINPLIALLTSAVVAISSATKDALVRYEFIPRKKIQVIYNGISPLNRNALETQKVRDRLGIPQDAFVVGTVSRLDPVKNQSMMLRAFKEFFEHCPGSYLLMVGDGPDKEKLIRLSADLGISERTIFTGFINNPVNELSAIDVFLLSSLTEGTSMTLLEAMSLGIPSVVTDVGGNPEIVNHNVTGLVTKSNEKSEFASAITEIYKCRNKRKEISIAALEQFHDKFTRKKFVSDYLSIYHSVRKHH